MVRLSPTGKTSPFSPLARAVMDSFGEGVVVFDSEGQMIYANVHARASIDTLDGDGSGDARELMPLLARLGGRIAPLRAGALTLGEAVYLPLEEASPSLADREQQAIVHTLKQTDWKLAEAARLLGISRTTLWRRLKRYGLHRDKRGKWAAYQSA